jgi:hypothetical protein
VGIACSRQISIEKYATVDRAGVNVIKTSSIGITSAGGRALVVVHGTSPRFGHDMLARL